MAKNGTIYKKNGGIYHPLTNTNQVMNPDGTRLEQRLTDDENAVKGKGNLANAKEYPFRYLGEFNSITALNTALNEIFYTTDEKWQGNLRAVLNGQIVFIHQVGIYIARGDWAQIIVGLVAPSSDNTLLVASSTPNILWRSRDSGGSTVVRNDWQTLSSVNLKTVNGQSLLGSGNITIGSSGTITVDSALDGTSTNPVQNKKVYAAIQDLQAAIEGLSSSEGGVIVCKQWIESGQFTTGTNGDYGYRKSDKTLHKYVTNAWVEQTGWPKEGIIYIDSQTHASYFWNGTDMQSLLGESTLSTLNTGSSAPVNSEAVKKFVEGDRKVIKCTYWQSSTPTSGLAEGMYYYDTTNNTIEQYINGSWTELGEPKEGVLYMNPNDGLFYKYEDEEWTAILDETMKIPSIPSSGSDAMIPTVAAVRGYVTKDSYIPSSSPSATNIPTTSAVKTYVDNAVSNADGGDSGSSTEETRGFGTDNYGDPLFPEYYLQVTYNGSSVNLGALYNSDVAAEKAAADAFIETINWGIPFYDWPLRCYNGTKSGITVQSGTADVEVFAPSERMWYKYDVPGDTNGHDPMSIPYTTENVYFNTDSPGFVLEYDGNYYSSWKNSGEWNKQGMTTPRTDCIFSDISESNASTHKAVRTSKIWGLNGAEELTDIYSLMTDFVDAVTACFTANFVEGGSMQARFSDKIYYTSTGWKSSLTDKNAFTIDGGKSVLFYGKNGNGYPSAGDDKAKIGFGFVNCKDVIAKNLTMRVIRDTDFGAPSGHKRFSCSDSGRIAFGLENGTGLTDNILLKNIDTRGFKKDLDMGGSISNITVDGWKSRDFTENTFKGSNIIIRNADWEQAKYIGGGMHIVYGQVSLNGVTFEDCRFKAGPYTTVMVSFHGTGISTDFDIVIRRCTFEGCRLLKGCGQRMTVEDCNFIQTTTRMFADSGTDGRYWGVSTQILEAGGSKWNIRGCKFHTIQGSVFGTFNEDGKNNPFQLFNCELYIEKKNSEDLMLTGMNRYNITLDNVLTNYISQTFNATYNMPTEISAIANANYAADEISNIYDILDGAEYDESVSTYNDLASVVDLYNAKGELKKILVESNGIIYRCTNEGSLVKLRYLIRITDRPSSGNTLTGTITIPINANESIPITLTIDATSTMNAILKNAIDNASSLVNSKLKEYIDANKVQRDTTDYQDSSYLIFTSFQKVPTTKVAESGYSVHGTYLDAGVRAKSYNKGAAPTWEATGGASGLKEMSMSHQQAIEELESKVQPDVPISGSTRPNPATVGAGYCFFDTSLGTSGKPIFSTGSGWVYADGTAVGNS